LVKDANKSDILQSDKAEYTLTWTYQNTGTLEWPMDVRFVRANGDQELKACSTKVFYGAVAPGATIDVSVKFSNPEKAGNYIALFRLSHGPQGNGIEFGDKAIADVQVKEQPKP
jgi:hypothetical protein